MVDVAPISTGRDERTAMLRFAEAQEEYRRVMTSLYALGSQLSALQATIQGAGLAQTSGPTDDGATHPMVLLPIVLGPSAQDPTVEASAPVRVSLLGPFQMYIGGRGIGSSIPRQVRTVVEFLLSQGRRPTSKDAILDLLWPETNPTLACSRLRVVMHTLRKSIPSTGLGHRELVVTSGNNFMVNPDITIQVDVEEFERRWLNGWKLAKAGRTQEALAEYEQAEALYTGDYLEDEPYADWTLLRREALRDAYANILTMLATMSLDAGDYTGATIWSQKLLAQDNCREDAYRLLITGHLRLGQTSRAAHWYNLCVWALQRELGIEPSAETQALSQQL